MPRFLAQERMFRDWCWTSPKSDRRSPDAGILLSAAVGYWNCQPAAATGQLALFPGVPPLFVPVRALLEGLAEGENPEATISSL